jgi:hypothetical protein
METEKIIKTVLKVTGKDFTKESRVRDIVEARAIYYKVMKTLKPNVTLREIGEPLNKNHASVLHILKQYDMFAMYNPIMNKQLKQILSILDYKQPEYILEIKSKERINELNIQVHLLREDILELKKQLKDKDLELTKPRSKYTITNKLEILLSNTEDTEQHEVLLEKLEAFYNINNKLNLYKKHYEQY